MKLDPTKEYQYRNGEKPWKIIWDVPHHKFPIISIDKDGDAKGHYFDGSSDCLVWDLIEVKKKIKGWVNVYKEGFVSDLYNSRETADHGASLINDRIACIEIEFEEGEGL
jgi:hypothetical protein